MEFKFYSPELVQVMKNAKALAKSNRNPTIDPEHILLKMLDDKSVAEAFSTLRVNVGELRQDLEKILAKTPKDSASTDVLISTRLLSAGAFVEKDAAERKIHPIPTNVFLLGLVNNSDDPTAKLLEKQDVSTERLYELLFQQVSPSGAKAGKDDSNIGKFTTDMTALARRGMLGPIIGRDTEIRKVIEVLGRASKNNPILVGQPGVGRSSIIAGLAERIARNDVPKFLQHKRILVLDLASLVAGATLRGQFEERVKGLMNEVRGNKRILLFVDQIHTMMGTGGEGASDASSLIKPALARGEVQLMGTTTPDEYRNSIEKDAGLERRFEAIQVDEPSEAETLSILRGLRSKYELHHKVNIEDPALVAAIQLSKRYMASKFLPEKAIGLVDAAASRLRISIDSTPHSLDVAARNVVKIRKELKSIEQDKHADTVEHRKTLTAKLVEAEGILLEREGQHKAGTLSRTVVSDLDINEVVSAQTGIPITKLSMSESERLLQMESILGQSVIGQKEAIQAISKSIRRSRAGMNDPKRPVGSFFFLGPTGCGKTELAKTLAKFLFDDESAMVRLDMSEFQEKHAVSRLIGSPPGYVGSEDGGQLTEAVRAKPYSVVLFDEVEKAHIDLFNLLLQILDDGRLSDSKSRLVDFKNTVIIMTSNVGSQHLLHSTMEHGFVNAEAAELALTELRAKFRPEFLGRIDEVVQFHGLTKDNITQIADLQLRSVEKLLAPKKMKLEFTTEAKNLLVERGYDPKYGARPLRREIQKRVQDELATLLLAGKFAAGDTILATVENEQLVFIKKPVV